jgi:NAD(P)-dependent dehydrogenase (short-subunit alcohol dehydrogenase family)
MTLPVAVVVGAGGALGVATCRALGGLGYSVVALGRRRAALEAELGSDVTRVLEVDCADVSAMTSVLERIESPEVLVYNAGRIDLLPLAQTTPEVFVASWEVNALGAFLAARAVAPSMIARGRGKIVFVGATASLRGGARAHAFASAKHALRGLAGSLARELDPKGVHVSHLVIDGKIWGAKTRARFPDVREDQCLSPEAVAHTICALVEQPPSAWTFELDLRPSVERWS